MFVDFCEDWDTTETQNDFIKKYFGKRKIKSTRGSNASEGIDMSKNSLSLNMKATETSNCESNKLKNKKRKKNLVDKNISNDLSKQFENINDFNGESMGSNSDCQKRKNAKKIFQDESLISNKLFVETNPVNKTTFSDSSIRDNIAFENNPDSNCSKKKKKKLKNIQKHGEFSFEDSPSLEKSYDLSAEQNNVSEASSNALVNDSVIKGNHLDKSDSYSLKKKRKRKKLKIIEKSSQLDLFSAEEEPTSSKVIHNLSHKKNDLFQNKAYQKLQAAKFRYLNEMLYTNSGRDSLNYFQQNTDEFLDYHNGYQSQVSKWPINPVDIIIQELSKINKQAVIADLGCGEAKIAEVFPKRTVHSFDLIALKDCVTACDMAKVPLPSNSVDVVIFCLSLMGTNWKDYLKEGQRILKLGGTMKIAEIESRIENVEHFIKEIENFGFSLVNQDLSHKMFVFLNFKRISRSKKFSKVPEVTLKPCLYKKR